jgi:hypothetical protein
MEVYIKTGVGLYEEKLITLYPTFYEYSYNSQFNSNPDVQNFFKGFYQELNQGKIIESNVSKKQLYAGIGLSKPIDERKFFSLDSFRFRSITDLDKHFAYGLSLGYEFEVMNHFRNQFIEKNFR